MKLAILLAVLTLISALGVLPPSVARAQQAPPVTPTDLVVDPNGVPASYLALFWRDNASNEDAYQIERSNGGVEGPWQVVATIATRDVCALPYERQCAYIDRLLAPDTTYWYRVAAVNVAGASAYSNVASARTGSLPTPGPGEVRGFVFHDANGNGLRDTGEAGLERRRLTLLQEGHTLQTGGSGHDGEYLFYGLSAGEYTLVVDLNEYHTSSCGGFDFSYNPLQRDVCDNYSLPWDGISPERVDVMLTSGARVNFAAEPADAAVVTGDAILELDHAAAGTTIVALVNGRECGTATVVGGIYFDYSIHVLGAGERAGCAVPGDDVHFTVAGRPAAQVLTWTPFTDPRNPGRLTFLNLIAMEHNAWYWYEQIGDHLPADGTVVQAVIDGVVCGEAVIEARPGAGIAGFSRLVVPSEELQPGCGRPDAAVLFLVGGVAKTDPLPWRPGLHFINPLVRPVIVSDGSGPSVLPGAGTGGGGEARPATLAVALFFAAALVLAGGALAVRQR